MTNTSPQIDPELGTGAHDILLVGRDLGSEEVKQGRPFANMSKFSGAGYVLNKALGEAGIRRKDLLGITNVVMRKPPGNNFHAHSQAAIERGLSDLRELISDLDPNLIVTLGNVAARALISDWPTKKNRPDKLVHSKGIRNRRGFVYEGDHEGKVLATIHPSAIQRGAWVPFRMLLTEDLEKAKKEAKTDEFRWPEREVTVPTSEEDARALSADLSQYDRLAADIEITDEHRLACCGFAGESGRAVVFPATYASVFRKLLCRDQPRLVWANGQFDLHFLKTRCGIEATISDDTQLAWHAMYPELAGSSKQDSYRMTRKGLSFLASLYTSERYWKNYDFSSERERYELNGIDCCVTLEIMQQLDEEIDQLGVREIYEHNVSLVWPAVEMQARGLHVHEEERRRRLSALNERYDELADEVNEIVRPLLEERSERLGDDLDLFIRGGFETETGFRETCPCCNGGKKKSQSCTDCAGIEGSGSNGAIVKTDLVDWAVQTMGPPEDDPDDLTKDELRNLVPPCQVCNGDGKRTQLWMNPTSEKQQKLVLYELLKAPKRYKSGSLTTDKVALTSLLGEL